MKRITTISLLAAAVLFLAGAGPLRAAAPRGRSMQPADSQRVTRKRPSSADRASFSKFVQRHGKNWKIRYSPRTALPEAITGGRTTRYPGSPQQAVSSFLKENRELLKVDPAMLRPANEKAYLGITHVQYQQYYNGIPVEFAYARAHVTASGEITGYQARFEPDISISIIPSISAEQAQQAVYADLGRRFKLAGTELVLFPDENDGALKLAWKVQARSAGHWIYYIDASNSGVLLKYDDLRRATPSLCKGTVYNTMGRSSATVYEISPLPSGYAGYDVLQVNWVKPVLTTLTDQYFWVGGISSFTATNDDGDYCTNAHGKVFSTFKGPYFSVTNARGLSAHFDNGGGKWKVYNHPSWIQSGATTNLQDTTYPVNIPETEYSSLGAFMKAVPYFDALSVGSMDQYASVDDEDQLQVYNNLLPGNNMVAAYITQHTQPFHGASVESSTYTLRLLTDASGTSDGFVIKQSSYMYIPTANSPSTTAPGILGSVVWSTSSVPGYTPVYMDTSLGHTSGLDEVNAFYHLNKARVFHETMNKNPFTGTPKPINLDSRVAVMVHANGTPDTVPYPSMLNGYYDLTNDYIVLGDGPVDYGLSYRSFALDGTVLRHEYTHLVHSRIYPIINYGECGALSEAMADYFSLASFWREGKSVSILGNFLGGSSRDLSGATHTMPADWVGEVHDDSLILSEAMYSLRNGGTYSLGTVPSGTFSGLPVADVIFWAALFYFPDNFTNYFDAVKDACRQLEVLAAGSCGGAGFPYLNLITTAFGAHSIPVPGSAGDSYETSANSGMCQNNNGPECAAELSGLSSISATISPSADLDYYSLPVAEGNLQATLTLPPGGAEGTYKAYGMILFDANRKRIAEAMPVINDYSGYCPDSGDCLTLSPSVSLSYPYAPAGRYYLAVAGAYTYNYGNSGVNSLEPYTLSFSYTEKGAVEAYLDAGSSADNDRISFLVPHEKFPMSIAPTSSTLHQAEVVYYSAQLREHNGNVLALARTDLAGSLLQDVTCDNDAPDPLGLGRTVITGTVRVLPGFALRYPGVGTVSVEVFGKNHMGKTVSLGRSRPFNLSTDQTTMITYNNLLGDPAKVPHASANAIIKYELQTGGALSIKVYTQAGTLVKTVYERTAPAGKGTLNWDGTNSSGTKAASGIYYVKAKGPGLDKIEKIAIVR